MKAAVSFAPLAALENVYEIFMSLRVTRIDKIPPHLNPLPAGERAGVRDIFRRDTQEIGGEDDE